VVSRLCEHGPERDADWHPLCGVFLATRAKENGRQSPADTAEIRKIVEPQAQADPKFQTTLAYTRVTAKAVRDQLLKHRKLRDKVPGRQAIGTILNRMGYSLKRVQKTRPEKNSGNRRHLRQRPDISAASVERTEHAANIA
jgi:transposase